MKLFSIAFAILICAGSIPALSEEITAAQCALVWDETAGLRSDLGVESQGTENIYVSAQWCRLDGWRNQIDGRPYPVSQVDSIEWRGDGLAEFADTGATPVSFEVRIRGLRVFAQIGDPAMDYVYRTQSASNSIDLDALFTWDPKTNRFELARVFVDFPQENSIKFSAVIDNVDMSTPRGTSVNPAVISLKKLSLEIESNGLFEYYALPVLAPIVLGRSEQVELEVLAMKAKALALVASLDTQVFSVETKRALSTLITDLPLPHGTFRLDIRFENGFGLQEAKSTGERSLDDPSAALPDGITVTAEYERSNLEP